MAKIRLGKAAFLDCYDDWFRFLETLYFRRRQKTLYRFWFWNLKSSVEIRTQREQSFGYSWLFFAWNLECFCNGGKLETSFGVLT